ncbi:MAG: DUF4173 domain-containing protein [Acidimicrobiales bacterium]|nr:DUF4173 domain-containing protein [Acidimicrobiales bacterium]
MTSTLPPPPSTPPPPRAEERLFAPPHDLWRITPGPRLLGGLVLGGVAVDLGVRHPVGALSLVAVALLVAAGRAGGWVQGDLARRLHLLALVPAALLCLRATPWLVPLNVIATLGLLALAAAVRDEPGALGRAVLRLVRPTTALEPAVLSHQLATRSVAATVRGRDTLARRIVRALTGLAIVAPVAAVLIALLAASDALFRSWISVPFDLPTVTGHLVVVGLGAMMTAALAGHGGWAIVDRVREPRRILGSTEATMVLGVVVAIYAVFVAAQVVAISAGERYVERNTSLDYSEYARSGFFQLLAASVLTLAVLLAVDRWRRRGTEPATRRIRRLELATIGLTLVVVGVAIRRLFLYEAEFGLTMLRLYTIVFAAFIGVVFLVVAAHLQGRLRHHPVGVVAGVALTLLLAMNLVNPEALVARRNLDRFAETDQLDVAYLVDHLGVDAIPTILDDPTARAEVCARAVTIDDRVMVFNWGRVDAARAIDDAC